MAKYLDDQLIVVDGFLVFGDLLGLASAARQNELAGLLVGLGSKDVQRSHWSSPLERNDEIVLGEQPAYLAE